MKKFYIGVCMGIACRNKGADSIYSYLEEHVENTGGTLVPVRCIGDCGNAPIVLYNGEFLKKQTIEDIKLLLNP